MAVVHKGKRSLSGAARRLFLCSALYAAAGLAYVFMLLCGIVFDARELLSWLPLPVLAWGMAVYSRRYRKMKAGATGERAVLYQLKKLSKCYHIFTNYIVRYEGGWDEIDFIVVGECGVFVLEAKHHAGRIEGSVEDGRWRQKKFRAGRKTADKSMANPVKQTRRHQGNVARLLRKHGFRQRVAALLVFTNPRVYLDVDAGGLPLVKGADGVNPFLLDAEPRDGLSRTEVSEIAACLKKAAAR